MDWKNTPSLAALRAFEATVRTGTMTAAAAELNVTHAAVAQHVRTLNEFFGTPLLAKRGKNVEPTDKGRQLADGLNDGFGKVVTAIRMLQDDQDRRPLVVSTTSNFAENWLMQRLPDFWSKHPEIPVTITTTDALVDLDRDPIDLAIRYGNGNWRGLEVQLLTKATYQICAAPSLIARYPQLAAGKYNGVPWIMSDSHSEAEVWARDAGYLTSDQNLNRVPTMGSLRVAVASGAGVAVLIPELIEHELATGTLMGLASKHIGSLGYYIVGRRNAVSERQTRFIRWLKSKI